MPYISARSYRRGGIAFLIGVRRNQSKISPTQNPIPSPQPPSIPTTTTADADPKATKGTQEFDEYGAELEPDARVWKTYVKEASNFDLERVDGWNRSLDMTFIYAAFFAATCTAFLIESSKSLKEDPAERSARRLDQIAILLANISNPSTANFTGAIDSEPFSPRTVDICINVLWTFSLITSAAMAPIAMLAKDWCYLFMADRVGDPWSQTKQRQQRWEGIKKWKMDQVIMVLPSLIHLSFLSFAIGLCIYLGDMSLGTSIPAALVTLGSILIYVASTIFPLLNISDTVYPYSTSLSQFIQRRGAANLKGSAARESENASRIAVGALAWLIKTSEDPKTTDIALQAIAGADPNNANQHRELLKQAGADTMISRRLIGLDSYSNNYGEILDLYTRAQAFFQPSNVPVLVPIRQSRVLSDSDEKTVVGPGYESRKASRAPAGPHRGLNRELQRKIRELRDTINREITTYVTSSHHIFISTPDNIQALRIGSTAASHCLRTLQHGLQLQTTQKLFDSVIELLDSYRNGSAYLNDREIHYLMIGTAMLLSSLLIKCPADFGARYVMRLLRIADRVGDVQRQLRLEYLSLPLVVYALSQHDFPGWTQPPPLSPTSRAERAIEVITHYVGNRDRLSRDSPFMVNLALLELISTPEGSGYKLDDTDIAVISEAFAPTVNDQTCIYTFPEHTLHDSFPSLAKSMDKVISNGRSGPLGKDAVTIACLTMLNRTRMDQKVNDPPLGEVYAFVVECILALSYSGPEALGPNTALDLMEKFHDSAYPERIQNLMPNLARSLDKRGTFARLRKVTSLQATEEGSNFVIKMFATGQAWSLIDLAIKSKATDNEDWRRCLSSFVEDKHLWDSSEHAMRVLGEYRSNLADQYRAMWDKYVTRRHRYFKILFDSLT